MAVEGVVVKDRGIVRVGVTNSHECPPTSAPSTSGPPTTPHEPPWPPLGGHTAPLTPQRGARGLVGGHRLYLYEFILSPWNQPT